MPWKDKEVRLAFEKKKYNTNKKFRKKNIIRSRTRRIYGRLPMGWQYHHIEPYHEDVWIGVAKEEHKLFDEKFK